MMMAMPAEPDRHREGMNLMMETEFRESEDDERRPPWVAGRGRRSCNCFTIPKTMIYERSCGASIFVRIRRGARMRKPATIAGRVLSDPRRRRSGERDRESGSARMPTMTPDIRSWKSPPHKPFQSTEQFRSERLRMPLERRSFSA